MDRPIRFTPEMIDEYSAKGYWTEETTSHLWEKNSKLDPDKEALVSSQRRLTWSQLKQISDRLAWGFLEIGLKRGDLLLLLVPNCCESYMIRVACEGRYSLFDSPDDSERKRDRIHFEEFRCRGSRYSSAEFRGFDYYTAIHDMHPRLPGLKYIFTIGDEVPTGTISIEELMQDPLEKETSGGGFSQHRNYRNRGFCHCLHQRTTGLPKGVEHAQCTRMAAPARNYGSAVRLTGEDVVLNIVSALPGLGAAFCYNGSAPLVVVKSVLLEIWSPEKTFQRIEKEKATVLVAVPAQIAQIIKDPGLYRAPISFPSLYHRPWNRPFTFAVGD